jgi:equilibrative nucleoside transporter 1/2/3
MNRLRQLLRRDPSYEPLEGGSETPDGEQIVETEGQSFSWIDYSIFVGLGIAMLWAWSESSHPLH